MIVQTSAAGSGATFDERVFDVRAGETTLRELLGLLVRQELDAYERRLIVTNLLQILTPADLAGGASKGAYGRERRAVSKAPSFDDALARAVEAFEDGLYFVFLTGQQVEELDALIAITEDSVLRLIRLVALSGVQR